MVLVEDVTMAKSGKSLRVKLSGQWYGAYLDSGFNNPAVKGTNIEAEIVTLDKGGPWIKAWKASAVPAAPQVQSPKETREREPQYAEPAKPGTVAPWWGPMASNVIAHAITAGELKTPNQVHIWFQAVKMAAENQSDGDVPF